MCDDWICVWCSSLKERKLVTPCVRGFYLDVSLFCDKAFHISSFLWRKLRATIHPPACVLVCSGLRRLTIFQILCCWQTLSNYCHSRVKQTRSEFSSAGVLQLGVNICQCMSGTLNSLYEQRHGDSQRCAGLTSWGEEGRFMRLFCGVFEGSNKAKNC